ncbi:MAG: BatD family protein [Desulfamplus sp.]|nr:BatD family protein [Desulfamplus sp.]
MNLKVLKLVILITSFLLINPLKGFCFNVTAMVDRNSISINDSIALSVVFEDGEGEVDTSAIADFTIVSQSSSSNISIINGKYSKSVTTTYSLIPKKVGTLKIPPLKVEYDNKIYATQEITIEVSGQSTNHKDKGSKDIFVESGISRSSLFTGEQAVYQLRFYSAVKLSNASLQPPSFKGFTAKEAGERKSYKETINGRLYYVTEINYVIIPETAGELEIEPAVIVCDVPVRRNNRSGFPDPFDDPFFSNNGVFSFGRSETRQFATEPIAVKVEQLPSYPFNSSSGSSSLNSSSSSNKASGNSGVSDNIPFSGLVGDFSIDASLDNSKLKIGDSATLTITISGKGNIMDAQAPSVLIPSDFKVYDDTPEESIQLSLEGYSGKKIFKKAIVPIKSVKYIIKPVVLSFFNVSKHKYETISTNEIAVEVENLTEDQQIDTNNESKSSNSVSQSGNDTGTSSINSFNNKMVVKKKSVEFTGKDILSIKEDLSVLVSKRELSFTMFLSLFFLPCLLFLIFKLAVAIGKRESSVSEIMLKRAKISLAEASRSLKEAEVSTNLRENDNIISEQFFKRLHDALIAMLISKTNLQLSNGAIPAITAYEATQILTDAGSSKEVAIEFTSILNEIESARYGKQENTFDYRYQLLAKTQKLFQTLGVLIIFISAFMLSVLLLSVYPEKIYANEALKAEIAENLKSEDIHSESSKELKTENFKSGTLFLEGVKAYHNGDFQTAADKFLSIAQGKAIDSGSNGYDKTQTKGIKNPYLYYNLGNAYIKAGDVGRAILWYERAKKEIPLDPDLRFNLDYARGFVTDLNENFDISELIFFWKDYFPRQIIQYVAIALSFIFFIYSGVRGFKRKKIFTPAGVIIFLALVFAGCTSFYLYYSNHFNKCAIVVSKEASVRSGNSKDATQLFILHSGTKVRVEEIKDNYLKILFSKDKIGWVSVADAEII